MLLHGQPGSAADWQQLAGRLPGPLDVVALDRPGYGTSQQPAGGFGYGARAVLAELDARGIGRAVLVGHSYGGGVALSVAQLAPGRVEALVLLASVGPACLTGWDRLMAAPVTGEVCALTAWWLTPWVARARLAAITRRRGRPITADEHVNWHIWGHAHHDHGPLWRSFLTEQRALVQELGSLTASLADVTQPVLLIADPDDTLIPVSTTHQLAAALPDARVQLLSGIGHHLPRRGAAQTAAAITGFLTSLDSSRTSLTGAGTRPRHQAPAPGPAAWPSLQHGRGLIAPMMGEAEGVSMVSETPAARLAVLIDADNAQPAMIEELLAEVAKYGTAHVKRAFGDWTGTSLKGWKDQLLAQSIQPIQQFAYTRGKNATDAAMVIDAMDLLYSGRFDGFCIVSSDSDFTRLAARIRESGLTVYGFGERKTPKPFVAACDKFIYIENLSYAEAATEAADEAGKPVPRPSAAQLKADTALINQLRNAVEAASDDDGWATLASVGHIITNQSPDFDSRTYGYAKLSDLMTATTLFEMDRRSPGDGKPGIIYVRAKRRHRSPARPAQASAGARPPAGHT